MSRQARVTFNDEQQSLIDNSNTHPAVLVAKLLTDAWAREYDVAARVLMERRHALLKRLQGMVHNGGHPTHLNYYWDQGAKINLTVDFVPAQYLGITSVTQVEEFFKSLDSSAPRRAADGMWRLNALSIFSTGAAAYLFSHVMFADSYESSTFGKQLAEYRKHYGMEKNDMLFGLKHTGIVFENAEPRPRMNSVVGGSLSLPLKNVDSLIYSDLKALAEDEAALVTKMYKDATILSAQAFRIRALDKIIKKIPDVLEHPDFKLLLGYDVNPQQERVDFINRTLTGEALLNPAI